MSALCLLINAARPTTSIITELLFAGRAAIIQNWTNPIESQRILVFRDLRFLAGIFCINHLGAFKEPITLHNRPKRCMLLLLLLFCLMGLVAPRSKSKQNQVEMCSNRRDCRLQLNLDCVYCDLHTIATMFAIRPLEIAIFSKNYCTM